MTRIQRLIREIHRRSLWQVLGVYVVGGWAALEAVGGIATAAGLPDWLPSLALVLLVLGLPIVLATAVVQEGIGGSRASEPAPEPAGRTTYRDLPYGDDVAAPAPPPARTTPGGVRRLLTWRNAILGGLAAFGLWGVVAAGLILTGSGLPARAAPATAESAELRGNGIAVLPFASRSADGEAPDFFASGLHDDLLTQLARVPGLTVISRTSVERYAGRSLSIPDIGRELGVAYVLEGGVQQAGGRIRMNAQLIDARTDDHLWAETFERDLTMAGIFAIQAELADRIAGEMRAALGDALAERESLAPTESLEAWEALARARELELRQGDRAGAIAELRRAVALDPEFAEAWATLSVLHSSDYWVGVDSGEEALHALERALVLAPGEPATIWAKGMYAYYVDVSYPVAFDVLDQAAAHAPGRSDIMESRAYVLRRLGRYDEAVESLERAIGLDPANPVLRAALAETIGLMGRQEAMRQAIHEALAVDGAWTEQTLLSIANGAHVMADVQTLDLLLERMPAERRESGSGRDTRWRRDYLVEGTRPDPGDLRQLMQAERWELPRSGGLSFTGVAQHAYAPPWSDAAHLDYLVAGIRHRLARGLGAQAALLDRSLLAVALARLGDREAAVAEAERVIAWVRRTDDRLIGGWALLATAVAMETLGDRARAAALLGEALDQGRVPMAYLRTDPSLESLRADPQVRAMLEARAAREEGAP
jgi:TolB-like protein/Tfp pilus assembly protein PilF